MRKSFSSGVQSHTIAAAVIPSQRHPNDLDVGGIEGSAWMSLLIGKNQSHSFRYNRIPETDEGQPLRHGTNCLRFDMLTVAETAEDRNLHIIGFIVALRKQFHSHCSKNEIAGQVYQLPVSSLGMRVAFPRILVASESVHVRRFLVVLLVSGKLTHLRMENR